MTDEALWRHVREAAYAEGWTPLTAINMDWLVGFARDLLARDARERAGPSLNYRPESPITSMPPEAKLRLLEAVRDLIDKPGTRWSMYRTEHQHQPSAGDEYLRVWLGGLTITVTEREPAGPPPEEA